jgi:hypothetical protein
VKITFHDSRRVIDLPSRDKAAQAEAQTQPPEPADAAPDDPVNTAVAAATNDVEVAPTNETAAARAVVDAAPAPRSAAVAASASPFLPLLLSMLALAVWLGHQAWQLAADRQSLQAAHAAQQPTVDNAAKLRTSLDALAADTQRLADGGNPNAKLLVDELKKRGVTINPQAVVGR